MRPWLVASIAVGVGQPAILPPWRACRVKVSCLLFCPGSASLAVGVRHPAGGPVEASADVRRPDGASCHVCRPDGIAEGLEVKRHSREPFVPNAAANLLSKDDCRAVLAEAGVKSGP